MVYYKRPGGPDVLRIKEVPNPPCVTIDLIMIQVAAAGLNVYDAWRRQGGSFYQSVFIDHMGYECSGLLLLENGDAYAEFVVAPACQAFQIPSCVSVVEAAALLEASRLTFFAFSGLTNVTPGKTILIHGAAAGIDFIAIQYAKYIGCQVFAVAGATERSELLTSNPTAAS
ncbi:uncharacterized protein [Henckelia pumila]|uniref:uncharacterized protein n=1 Tax=Henckelia pumila TaxID=405737 RepID=UPI003C6E4239